jgi:LacI family transcriptional regulator
MRTAESGTDNPATHVGSGSQTAGLVQGSGPESRITAAQRAIDTLITIDRWLAALPRPGALFACNDTVGLKAAAAAPRLGIEVPADLALLGLDSEDILCELSVPPLSSIALDLERIGWEAAKAQASLMDARPGRTAAVVSPPEVVERESTRTLARGDALVDGARGVIHGAAAGRLTVAQLLAPVPRTLEKRFRSTLCRSIHQEIIRRRIDEARLLLRDTTFTISAVAEETDSTNAQRFYAAFRKAQGATPGACRRSYRG